MKGGTAGLALLLALATLQVPYVAEAATLPHAPISITSDAGFTAANGVVAGTGTPGDPYVISGWQIASASGTAILIQDTTVSYVVRGNILEGSTGLRIRNASAPPLVQDNHFIVRTTGVFVSNADAVIRDNTFVTPGGYVGTGIKVEYSAAVIHANSIDSIANGIVALRGSTTITSNDIHRANTGIFVDLEAYTVITGNNVTVSGTAGIYVKTSIHVQVHGNVVWHAVSGIRFQYLKDVDMANNTVRFATGVGVNVQASSGNITSNLVIDGGSDAVQLWGSVMIMVSNRIENNLGIGIVSGGGACDIEANVIVSNDVGISITTTILDPCRLRANVLINNTIGLDIPYAGRQTIFWMEANIVNGVNVDGTLVPSERVYFYHAANVTISGQVRDSGFSAGFFGSLTAQGNVVLYEVDNARIEASVISHAQVGVTAVNSFNVVVEGSAILDTTIGVSASVGAANGPVPACAVSIKNSTINISIDPPLTVGVDARGCLVNVQNTSIGTVSTGIRLDGSSWGNVSGNRIWGTQTGLDISGLPGEVSVVGNTVLASRVGARFTASAALVLDNEIRGNTRAGVVLDRSSLTFGGNDIVENGEGVIDLLPCATGCSSLDARSNVVARNGGDGVRVNGTSTFRGDLFQANGRTGARLGSATLLDVNASFNGEDGASVAGRLTVRDSEFAVNDRHGLRFVGQADLRDSSFTRNGEAGIRATATFASATRINSSLNMDGLLLDELAPGVDLGYFAPLDLLDVDPGAVDPFVVHLSKFYRNQRDAIRSGVAVVNATHNWFGGAPSVSVADTVGAFRNGVSPTVRFVPWYEDEAMTTTAPLSLL